MNVVFSGWSTLGDPLEGYCWSASLSSGKDAVLDTLRACLQAEADERSLQELWAKQGALSDADLELLARPTGIDVWLVEGDTPRTGDKPIFEVALRDLSDPNDLVDKIFRYALCPEMRGAA